MIYIIATEASGDKIAAALVRALYDLSNVEIHAVGGESLCNVCKNTKLSDIFGISGITEVIPNLFKIKKFSDFILRDIKTKQPKIVVTIDSPDFCIPLAKKIRHILPNTKLVHYVAPTVWAWRSGRTKAMAKIYDALLTLFSFEPQFFEKEGLKSIFVGHPAAEEFINTKEKRNEDILILPGSRTHEIERLFPIFLYAAKHIVQNGKIIVATLKRFEHLFNTQNIEVQTDENIKKRLFQTCKIAIAASGTVTLQLALSGCPMVVGYKMSPITFNILRHIVKTPYISLPNIIMQKEIVKELIQNKCTLKNIIKACTTAKTPNFDRNTVIPQTGSPSYVAAQAILDLLDT